MFRFARQPPLRQTAVIGCPSVCQGWLSCWLCVAYFFSMRGRKNLKFCRAGKGVGSFTNSGLRVGLCGLQMCLFLCS
jgi:hypothetical protein